MPWWPFPLVPALTSAAPAAQSDQSTTPPESSATAATAATSANASASTDAEAGEFEFAIIDESGEGFGFDLDPDTVGRPLALASLGLFSVGALAGIPAGIAMGRAGEESSSSSKARPTLGGALFALRAFAYGTALCGALGAAGAYAVARHYDAWTWAEFGRVMREVVPRKREGIEGAVVPWLDSVRAGAEDGLPGPTARARDRFAESRVGTYIRTQIEEATRELSREEDGDGTEK
jgi:hypothetical protein